MARVEGTTPLAAIIAAQLAQLRAPSGKSWRNEVVGKQTRNPKSASGVRDKQAISQWIEQRVQSLASDDPARERKAFRIFLESVLLQEFGAGLIGDPGFEQLVDCVQQQMESDPELRCAIGQAGTLLLAAHDSA